MAGQDAGMETEIQMQETGRDAATAPVAAARCGVSMLRMGDLGWRCGAGMLPKLSHPIASSTCSRAPAVNASRARVQEQ